MSCPVRACALRRNPFYRTGRGAGFEARFKPDALGHEAQTALSRVVPVFGPRLAPRGTPL